MKLFLLNVQIYDYEGWALDTEVASSIYSSFEKAKEGGVSELRRKFVEAEGTLEENYKVLLEKEKIDYSFTITAIDDLEYAENFNVNYDLLNTDQYLKLEPTHKVFYLDYKGDIEYIRYEYRLKNLVWQCRESIVIYPEDLEEGASDKFKIGDIVKLKHEIDYGYKDDNIERLYVIRYLPRKFNGEKYFENKYALISLYKTEAKNKELFTFEYQERDIEKYVDKIDEDSEYGLLSKILKGDLKISREFWNKIKIGEIPLNTKTIKEDLKNEEKNKR